MLEQKVLVGLAELNQDGYHGCENFYPPLDHDRAFEFFVAIRLSVQDLNFGLHDVKLVTIGQVFETIDSLCCGLETRVLGLAIATMTALLDRIKNFGPC